ncbi:hypothetical protein Aperf_G00000035770 [Anoplocephala perfoliata]
MKSFSQFREHQNNGSACSDEALLVARKYLHVLRHAIECRTNERSGTGVPCQFVVCAQMRTLLDHVYTCDRGNDCTVDHCAVCKRLKDHSDRCVDPACRLCSARNFDDGSGVPHDSFPGNIQSGQQSVNGVQLHYNTYNSIASDAHSTNSSTIAVTNGFNWRKNYGSERRDTLIRSYAGQVFNPETYNDSRSDAVFTLFQSQEPKIFASSHTEEDYMNNMQRYVFRLRKELKHKLRHFNTNGSSSPIVREEPPEQVNLRSQSSVPCAGSACDSAVDSSKGKSSENSDSMLKPKPEAITPVTSNDALAVKIEEAYDASNKAESSASTIKKSDAGRRRVWTKEQLQKAFIPLVKNMSNQEPHSIHFRLPVAYEELRLTDYPSIVPRPMDLSTIEKKLENGDYGDPWDVVDDFWLMFNNAWRYNRKNTKIYKACTKLSEIFEGFVDPLMRELGFCCGRAYVHHPHVLSCLTEKSCNINRDDVYYVCETTDKEQKKEFLDKYIVCDKCYQSAGSTITIDDQSSPVHLEKSRFKRRVNNTIVHEKFVSCRECGRKWHKVCACHMDEIWPSGFVCNTCRKDYGIQRSPNRFTAKRLPKCKLSEFIEKRVNDFMKKNESHTSEVIIRVLASANKSVEVKKYMREIFTANGKFPESFPYRTKVIFAFQEVDGQEVCFFGLYVQEYSSDCPPPNTRRVYIAYLDSVYFFQPKQYRTDIYHEILIGYLHYAKKQGYANAHIWACPPGEGDDYIFHMHPSDQKIPKPKRLQDWYRKMLQKAHNERIVFDYKNIYEDASETKRLLPIDLPYFDGDLWPNTLEELLKPVVENRRRLREEEVEDCVEGDEDGDSNQGSLDCDRKPGSAGSGGGGGSMNGADNRKKTKKRKIKRAGSSMNIPGGGTKRKRLAAATNGDTEAEVQRRLEENLQRHAEAFLTINLYNSNQIPNLQPVKDPDPLFASDLMECRDSFLSRARERHLEFSTLRRAKFSTLAFLYDIHTENKDTIIYVCNGCQTETETPRLCKQCPNYHLCEDCFKVRGHDHPMTKVVVSDDSANAAAVQQSDRLRMERCVELLKHTSTCRDANCRISSCRDIKRRLVHMQTPHDRSKCLSCRQMNRIIVAHSVKCNDANCQVMFCAQYKAMKKQQESQQRLRKLQTLRRRQKTMQCANNIRTPQQPNTPQQQTGPAVNTPGGNSTSVAAPHAAATTTSPTVLSGPGSTETPQSFNSQVSMASPHTTSAPRNSPPKPTSVPTYPTTLQYSHTSPYQNPPHQSPLAAPKALGNQQTQHLTSAVEFQQSTTVASPFVQQPVLYHQQQQQHQQQQSQQLQMHPPQMQQSKSYPSDVGFVRQSSNPQGTLYENGQRGFINSPVVAMSPRMHFQPSMNPEVEEMYSMQSGPLKRQYFNEGDMMPTGSSSTNMYPMPGGGPQPPRQPRMMMPPQSQVANIQNSVSDSLQQQQTMMHWSGGGNVCATNGQVMPPNSINAPGNKMPQMPPSSMRPQQHAIPNQSTTPPAHLVNPVGQTPNATEVDMVVSTRRGFFNEIEQPPFIPTWNYVRSQQKGVVPSKPFQYPHSQSMPPQTQQQQQMMRGGPGYMTHAQQQQQRMMQQGQVPMSNPWSMQQPPGSQESWCVRQPCYAPQGKLPYNHNSQQQQQLPQMQSQPQQQQQQQLMPNNSYPPAAFPSRYSSPAMAGPSGNNPGVMFRPPAPQQRMPATPAPVSPRSQAPLYVPQQQQQQQNSLMLSQLLVQPHPQQMHQHPQQMQMQRPMQDGVPQQQQQPAQQQQIPR